MKWIRRAALVLFALYGTFFTVVLAAMHQPPERFGQFMSHVPQPLVWGALPARRMWLWAREGALETGEVAPDFTLSMHNNEGKVTLSSHRGDRPVVLVFGSYT